MTCKTRGQNFRNGMRYLGKERADLLLTSGIGDRNDGDFGDGRRKFVKGPSGR